MTKFSLRVGLELELIAPPGLTRFDFAERLARQVKGQLRYRLHYTGEGHLDSGRPNCALSLAARVLDADGRWLVDVVDDVTIGVKPSRASTWVGRTDDVRLALLAEAVSESEEPNPLKVLRQFARRTATTWVSEGTLADAVGHPLVVLDRSDAARHRVCEVVTRPLVAAERDRVVTQILAVARALKFRVPEAAAMHAHFDARAFRRVEPLRQLITRFSERREAIWRALQPNRRCTKLGPLPELVQRVAREATQVDLSFEAFSAALVMAGATKYCDLNLLGVIERRPRHPTLELRCLPVDFSAERTLERLDLAHEILRQCAGLT